MPFQCAESVGRAAGVFQAVPPLQHSTFLCPPLFLFPLFSPSFFSPFSLRSLSLSLSFLVLSRVIYFRFTCMMGALLVHMSVHHTCPWCLKRSEEGVRSLGTAVTNVVVRSTCVGSGNRTMVLCKSECSYPRSHFSSLTFVISRDMILLRSQPPESWDAGLSICPRLSVLTLLPPSSRVWCYLCPIHIIQNIFLHQDSLLSSICNVSMKVNFVFGLGTSHLEEVPFECVCEGHGTNT